jgi:transmembrane sensor
MAERETSRDIDQAASEWTARLDRGPLSPETRRSASRPGCRGDPRRKGALLRAQALSMMSESAQALGRTSIPPPSKSPGRSRFAGMSRRQASDLGGRGPAAATLAALGVGLPPAGR